MRSSPLTRLGLALALAACAVGGAAAQTLASVPSCWLVTTGKGYVNGSTSEGLWAAWWCPDGWGDWHTTPVRLVMIGGYTLRHPPLVDRGTTPAEVATSYWRQNVTVDCRNTDNVPAIDLCAAALRAARTTRPLPEFVVRPNGTFATRPTYAVVNGVRQTVSSGTVRVLDDDGRPIACNPAQTVREGSTTYMQVLRTQNRVALCSAR